MFQGVDLHRSLFILDSLVGHNEVNRNRFGIFEYLAWPRKVDSRTGWEARKNHTMHPHSIFSYNLTPRLTYEEQLDMLVLDYLQNTSSVKDDQV